MVLQVLITGSREATKPMLEKACEVVKWAKSEGHSVIVGDALGVDRIVRMWCIAKKVPVTVYGAYGKIRDEDLGRKPDGSQTEQRIITHGTYPERDCVMAEACDICVAIWNSRSRGTKITFDAAKKLGKTVYLRTFEKQ